MTQQEKDRLAAYRRDGLGCTEIARRLSLSVNTVKSYCRRNGLSGYEKNGIGATGNREVKKRNPEGSNDRQAAGELPREGSTCPQCGQSFDSSVHSRPKRFCSDCCRMAWWHAHRGEEKGAVNRRCPQCGRVFRTSRVQKYCSHACYTVHRFGGQRDE